MDTLQARLYAQLEGNPDGKAFTFYKPGGFSWQTAAELHGRTSRYAAGLADHGLRAGDVCLLVLPSEELCADLVLATLLLGAIPLLVAPPTIQSSNSSLAEVLDHIVGKTRPRIVVLPELMEEQREVYEKRSRKTRFLFGDRDLASSTSVELPRVTPGASDIAAMQLTSGTTGLPRVCVWKHEGMIAALDGMLEALELGTDDVCLNWTPLYHDMGLVCNYLLCLTSGIPLAMLSPHDFIKSPGLWLRGLSDTGTTMTWSPNFGYAMAAQRVRDEEVAGVRLDGVRAFINAAERIHYDTMLHFHERFAPLGVRLESLKTCFGCAENVGGATFSSVYDAVVVERVSRDAFQARRMALPVEGASDDDGVVTVVSAGRPYPGARAVILSRSGEPLPDGHIGELAFETPSRMVGYLRDAKATSRALYGDLLRTGDLAYTRDGEVFWVGRIRERINVRGRKLDPSDFEPILLQVDGLRKGCFVAFGVDDEKQGTQRIVVVSEVRDDDPELARRISREIREQAVVNLGVTIDDIVLVPPGALTKTSSGKRRHRHFRELYLAGGLRELQGDVAGAAR